MGYKTYTLGDLVTTADIQELQDGIVTVFTDGTARDAAITSPSEGMFAYLTGTGEGLYYYNGSAWVSTSLAGDISSVTVNTNSNSGLAGGQTASSGAFSSDLTIDANNLAAVTVDVANDSVIIYDSDGTATGKETIADLISAIAGNNLTASSGVLNAASGASIGLAIALG